MVSNFITQLTDAARAVSLRASRRLIFASAVTVCAITAVGFLTAALFLALANEIGAVGAAICVAGVYGFAAVAIAYYGNRNAALSRPLYETRRPSDTEALAGVIAAFMTGFRATQGSGGKKHD